MPIDLRQCLYLLENTKVSAGKKWSVAIKRNNKTCHLGYFKDEIEAASTYDRAAKKYHGQFASLNFPDIASENTKNTEKKFM